MVDPRRVPACGSGREQDRLNAPKERDEIESMFPDLQDGHTATRPPIHPALTARRQTIRASKSEGAMQANPCAAIDHQTRLRSCLLMYGNKRSRHCSMLLAELTSIMAPWHINLLRRRNHPPCDHTKNSVITKDGHFDQFPINLLIVRRYGCS